MSLRSLALVGIMTLAVAVPARAASIVINGGFETGDFTGWTQGGNTGFTGVTCPGLGNVPEGNCQAFMGPIGSDGTLTQNLATTAGVSYYISFFFDPDGGTPSDFSVTFGGVPLFSAVNPPATAPQFLRFTATAGGASTPLVFRFRDDPGFLFLDAVSVSAVPEPATLTLLGLGLAGTRFLHRKRRA